MGIYKTLAVGVLAVTILISGVMYVALSGQVRLRVDYDKTTLYVYNDGWEVAGREYNKLFDGSSRMNRNLSTLNIKYEIDNESITIIRETGFIRGPKIVDTYFFSGGITDKKMVPVYHKVEIFNAKGKYYRYVVDELTGTGPKRKLNGEILLHFGKNTDVKLHDGYKWAWIGWPYGEDSIAAQYKIESDYEVFYVKLFDPEGPQWYNNATNASGTTKVNQDVHFNLTMDDANGSGYYTFSWNDSGSWDNTTLANWVNGSVTTVINSTTATRGQIVSYYWCFNDSTDGWNCTDTWSFTMNNTVPTHINPIINTTTTSNYSSGNLSCWNMSTDDVDNDFVTNVYKWYRNSSIQSALENFTMLGPGNTTVDDVWICEVTPTDSESGTAKNSTPLTIVDGTSPQWYGNTTNATDYVIKYKFVNFNLTIIDETAIGEYTFSWNGTGSWTNTSMASWVNGSVTTVVKNLTAKVGLKVDYYWCFNDSRNNWNCTDMWSFRVANISINISTPTNRSYYCNVSKFNISVAGANNSCWYSYKGENTTISCTAVDTILYNTTTGSNTLIVYVNDTGGNINLSTVVFWGYAPEINLSFGFENTTYFCWTGCGPRHHNYTAIPDNQTGILGVDQVCNNGSVDTKVYVRMNGSINFTILGTWYEYISNVSSNSSLINLSADLSANPGPWIEISSNLTVGECEYYWMNATCLNATDAPDVYEEYQTEWRSC